MRRGFGALAASALVLTACSDGGGDGSGGVAATGATAPLPSSPSDGDDEPARDDDGRESGLDADADATTTSSAVDSEPAGTTTSPASAASEATSTTAVTAGDGDEVEGSELVPGMPGRRVDSAPGVNSPGEIWEVQEKVWIFLPTAEDPDDLNVYPVDPADADILLAYANAVTALYAQVTQQPIPIEPSDAMRSSFLAGGGDFAATVFVPRNEAGEHLGLFDGDLRRPQILGEPRSDVEVFIWDCALATSRYVRDETVDTAQSAPSKVGMLFTLVRRDDVWLVDRVAEDSRACL